MMVASAAPATPSAGKGPGPKMNRGSRIAFATSPSEVDRKTIELAPMAVNKPVSIWLIKVKIKPIVVIYRYALASAMTCGLCSLKKSIIGPLKIRQAVTSASTKAAPI